MLIQAVAKLNGFNLYHSTNYSYRLLESEHEVRYHTYCFITNVPVCRPHCSLELERERRIWLASNCALREPEEYSDPLGICGKARS